MSTVHDIAHAGKFLGDRSERRGGLPATFPEGTGRTYPPNPGTLGKLGKTLRGAAGSPILDAGQVLIAGMRLTTGVGEAELGEPFGQGATQYAAAGQTVGSAYPVADWQGSGAQAYATANHRQAGHAEVMASLDRSVQTVIAREAYQVSYHRDKLDDQSNHLADLSYVTWSIALIPGIGKAMKTALELSAVNAALSICGVEIHQLAQEAGQNAEELHELAGQYPASAGDAAPPDLDDPPSPLSPREPHGQETDSSPPGHATPNSVSASPPGAPHAAPTAGPPARIPPGKPVVETAVEPTVTPVDAVAPIGLPPEITSGMATAFGTVGAMIGSLFAPLAAVLTGAAGAAAQSMSTPANVAAAAEESRMPATEEEPSQPGSDGDRDTPGAGAESGPALPDVVAESAAAQPQSTDDAEQAPTPPPVPPAATRPPQ